MAKNKKHYSDKNGENVVHMPTPFALGIDSDYNYLRNGPFRTAGYFMLRVFALAILYPALFVFCGLRISGIQNARAVDGGAVVVCNHVHVLDCAMATMAVGLRRTYYVCAASNFCIPVIRHLVRWLGGVPLSRSPSQATELINSMEAAIADGKAVMAYPEGFLVPGCTGLRPFRRGAFKLAADTGTPVLPMRIVWRRARALTGLLRRRPLPTLLVLPPVYPDMSLPERERSISLSSRCRDVMLAAVIE